VLSNKDSRLVEFHSDLPGGLSRRGLLKSTLAFGLAAPAITPARARAQASGTLTVAMPSEPVTLDPQFAEGVIEYNVLINIMEGLFTTGEKVEPVPQLVEAWEMLDDLTWEFSLHQGIMFHNGEPFTAEAVKATYDRSVDPDLAIRNPWASEVNITEVEIVDDYTVRFHTSTFTPHMLARLANDHFIFPPKYLTETDPAIVARNPIGTGPYVFQEWVQGEQIVMTANQDYWGDPSPTVETVVWHFIPEPSALLANLQTGAADLIDGLLPTSIAAVEADANLAVAFVEGTRRVYIGLRVKEVPTDDVRVRQALNYGVNVEEICETILGGSTTRMTNFAELAFRNPNVVGYRYDPERARQLLSEAGYPDGFNVTLDYSRTAALGVNEFPQAIAIQLREVGVEVELNALEGNIHSERVENRETSQLYLHTKAGFFDPGLTFENWLQDDVANAAEYDEEVAPEFQELVQRMLTSGTPEERLEWSHQAQVILMEDAPAIFLWFQPDIYGINKRVQNFAPNGDERIRVAGITLAN
jgi:peptide/nickel transport system substrate-binding protein